VENLERELRVFMNFFENWISSFLFFILKEQERELSNFAARIGKA
jgi:hypothetical protein